MIDVVVTYVDNSDPKWVDSYFETKKFHNLTPGARKSLMKASMNRYSNRNLFKYWWRALSENTKEFLNKVYLVVASESQIPDWIDRSNKKLVILTHDVFIPKEYYPSFNSNTIELCLFKHLSALDDVTDNFLYLNDDMYFNLPSTEYNYVTEDGKPKCFSIISKQPAPLNLFRKTLDNTIKFCKNYTSDSKFPYYKHFHLGLCYNKKFCNEILNETWDKITCTFTRFRDEKNLIHWLINYLQIYKGISVNDEVYPHSGYTELPRLNSKVIENVSKNFMICFNDISNNDAGLKFAEQYFSEKYPDKCEYEL